MDVPAAEGLVARWTRLTVSGAKGWFVVFCALLIGAAPWHSASALAFEEHSFDSDTVEIRYITAGQGQSLLLIHGFSANADANWVLPGVMASLAKNFSVIAMDVRGHGKSGKPHLPRAYGVQTAQDVINLMDHLEIEKAHVVGYSMGGFIALKLLTLAPDRLLSVVTGGAGWMQPDEDPSLRESLAQSLESGGGMTPLLAALMPEGQSVTPDALAAMNTMVMANNDPLALAAVSRGLGELAVTRSALEANQVPVLAVVGARDPLKAGVDAMSGVLNNLRVEVIEGADHISLLLNPAQARLMTDAIEAFLQQVCRCA